MSRWPLLALVALAAVLALPLVRGPLWLSITCTAFLTGVAGLALTRVRSALLALLLVFGAALAALQFLWRVYRPGAYPPIVALYSVQCGLVFVAIAAVTIVILVRRRWRK
ncbi:MAG: hypothetical protein PHT12_00300 [Patescibacteria group bacterium]|nr:hypothetical protein [Patescibacteria group bacterium]